MTKKKKSRATRDAVRVQNGALRAARLSVIKSDILDNLRQPTLSIHAVAHRHGISARYIRQLFAADRASFVDFVLDRRLAAVHLMLNDVRFADRTISAIAFDVGFGDVSEFSRVFRRRYGATPSDVREAARLKSANRPAPPLQANSENDRGCDGRN
jgi:AraC-like DNA-binding protein